MIRRPSATVSQRRQRICSWRIHTRTWRMVCSSANLRKTSAIGLLDATIRILLDAVVAGLHIADRHGEEELAAARLLLHRLERALPEHRQLHLAHRALHAEQQPVVRRGADRRRRPRRRSACRPGRRTPAACASRARCAPAARPRATARRRRGPRRSRPAASQSRAARRPRPNGQGRRRSPQRRAIPAGALDRPDHTAAAGSPDCRAT